jgi:glutamate-ammonia-ligase adenylyltransferase
VTERQTSPVEALDPETMELVRAAVAPTADPEGAFPRMLRVLAADLSIATDPDLLQRSAAIAGVSRALSSSLAAHPELLTLPTGGWDSVPLRLRSMLISIAGDELMGKIGLSEATARLSDALDALVGDVLERARQMVASRHPMAPELRFAVIAMGKWGAREVNYYSDIDLVFVHEPEVGKETEARVTAIALASRVIADLSSQTFEGTALNVDVDLRPEGAIGPLSRSLDSYRAYYQRWGDAWELQALLKARPVAGDPDLRLRFRELADEVVWEVGLDVEALRSIRLLKARAEEEASSRDIKRSPGGIRDIEFAVQVLQLVHGRFDPDLRVTATLDAIEALGRHGYIEEAEAEELSADYIFLRRLEHRLQLWDLDQTHTMPDDLADRERIGRSLGLVGDPVVELERQLAVVRRGVRDLHERLYFRPILDALAGMGPTRLGPEEAGLRLAALGFKDVNAASRAFDDMTSGLSRRSRVMQQVLPLMLDWLSQSPDPDLGLDQMRLLLANTTDHGSLVTLLQNNPVAGERLCLLLGTGRLLGHLIDRIPEFIPRLADDQLIWDIRDAPGAVERLVGLLDSRPEPEAKVGTIRRFIRRRKLRIAARDVLGGASTEMTLGSLSDSADAALAGGLHALHPGPGPGLGVIAMGKWGGGELSYGSDVDLMYVYGEDHDRERATRLATDLERVIGEPGRHGEGYQLDSELRPEGRRGPLARSLESYRRYYQEWAQPWEVLALVKARPAVGDAGVLARFAELIEPVLWQERLEPGVAREIRMIKARVEAERIPPGQESAYHLKLGPGGLSDIEFLAQLLQLQHGGATTELRVTGTLPALRALRDAGRLAAQDFDSLHSAYLFLTRVRLRLHLQSGQPVDWYPTQPEQAAPLAASLGFDRQSEMHEEYRRHTRKARRVFEALFYE